MVNNAKDYNKCVNKPSLVSQKVFSKNFAAIHEIKTNLKLDKPIYIGFSVLNVRCMAFITIRLKENLMLSYYLQTLN